MSHTKALPLILLLLHCWYALWCFVYYRPFSTLPTSRFASTYHVDWRGVEYGVVVEYRTYECGDPRILFNGSGLLLALSYVAVFACIHVLSKEFTKKLEVITWYTRFTKRLCEKEGHSPRFSYYVKPCRVAHARWRSPIWPVRDCATILRKVDQTT